MTAKILDGKKLSEDILSQLKARVERLHAEGVLPRLDIILVGDDEASKIYVSKKTKSAGEIGMKAEVHRLPAKTAKEDVTRLIRELNENKDVHGILVQLPLPSHLDEQHILDKINPNKDVDGLTPRSIGRLTAGNAIFEPCTPKGIMKLLEKEGISIEGKNAVVVGRSNIVGKPAALMLLKRNATVTICHSKTPDLAEHTRKADIIVSAVGKPEFITSDMVKEGAVVIDAGISRSGGRVVGDIAFEKVRAKASHITPVPGGVGPLTVAMVLENTIEAAEKKTEL